jgi:hypothetical protein
MLYEIGRQREARGSRLRILCAVSAYYIGSVIMSLKLNGRDGTENEPRDHRTGGVDPEWFIVSGSTVRSRHLCRLRHILGLSLLLGADGGPTTLNCPAITVQYDCQYIA